MYNPDDLASKLYARSYIYGVIMAAKFGVFVDKLPTLLPKSPQKFSSRPHFTKIKRISENQCKEHTFFIFSFHTDQNVSEGSVRPRFVFRLKPS